MKVPRSKWGLTRSPSLYQSPHRSIILARELLQKKYHLSAEDAHAFLVHMQLEMKISRRVVAARIIREFGDDPDCGSQQN